MITSVIVVQRRWDSGSESEWRDVPGALFRDDTEGRATELAESIATKYPDASFRMVLRRIDESILQTI